MMGRNGIKYMTKSISSRMAFIQKFCNWCYLSDEVEYEIYPELIRDQLTHTTMI